MKIEDTWKLIELLDLADKLTACGKLAAAARIREKVSFAVLGAE